MNSILTPAPGALAERSSLIILTFPPIVTSLQSPGCTPDSNTPPGRMNATPLVVTPSYSPDRVCQVGAIAWRVGGRGGEKGEGRKKKDNKAIEQRLSRPASWGCLLHSTHRELYLSVGVKGSGKESGGVRRGTLALDAAGVSRHGAVAAVRLLPVWPRHHLHDNQVYC